MKQTDQSQMESTEEIAQEITEIAGKKKKIQS